MGGDVPAPLSSPLRASSRLLLGHADIRSTARYAQLDTTDLEAALRELHGGDV